MRYKHDFAVIYSVESDTLDWRSLTEEQHTEAFRARAQECLGSDAGDLGACAPDAIFDTGTGMSLHPD